MAFPPKLLNDGEEVVLDLNPHWWFFSGPLAAVLVSVAVTVAVMVLDLPDWLWFVVLGITAINLLWLVGRLAKWATTNFVVTTDRLIYRAGVFAKNGLEIPLERVNNIHFNQSVFERVLRSGDLLIESGGERGQQAFSNIRRPAMVQNEIYRQIEEAQGRDADRMAGRRELSIPEQIDKLDELRARGVITQAEFDVKKTQLLDRM